MDGRIDNRIDNIFDFIEDTLLVNNDYEVVDAIFKAIDLNKWVEDELVSFLTITIWCKDKFENRNDFFMKLKEKLLKNHSQKDVDIIIGGLN